MWETVRGIDNEAVTPKSLVKTINSCKSFEPTSDIGTVTRWLGVLAAELAERMAEDEADHTRRARTLGTCRGARHLVYAARPSLANNAAAGPAGHTLTSQRMSERDTCVQQADTGAVVLFASLHHPARPLFMFRVSEPVIVLVLLLQCCNIAPAMCAAHLTAASGLHCPAVAATATALRALQTPAWPSSSASSLSPSVLSGWHWQQLSSLTSPDMAAAQAARPWPASLQQAHNNSSSSSNRLSSTMLQQP